MCIRDSDQELSAGQSTGHYAYMDLVDLDALHAHHRWFIKKLSVELVVAKISRPTWRRISLTWPISTLGGNGTSTTALAQSRDRLVSCAMEPFGVMMTSPLACLLYTSP